MNQAIILLGHGSIREQANVEIKSLWETIAAQLPQFQISGAFVEVAEPTLEHEIERLVAEGAERIVIVPMFLTRGHHLANGIPKILDKFRAQHGQFEIELTEHLGVDPLLAEIIKNRLKDAGVS